MGSEVPPLIIAKLVHVFLYFNVSITRIPCNQVYLPKKGTWKIYFEGHFLQHSGNAQPQMIILDPHSWHQSLDLLKLAKANDIHSLALPLHTTDWLSPLDKTLFGPFQKEYKRVQWSCRSLQEIWCASGKGKCYSDLHTIWHLAKKYCQRV